jgi:hypothetical protein
VILQRRSFVSNEEEMKMEEADQNCGGATSWRRKSHWVGAEFGELIYSKERSGGSLLR